MGAPATSAAGVTELPRSWTTIRRDWSVLSLYQRFETLVVFVLTLVIGIVILVALCRLVAGVIDTLVLRALNPLAHAVFQRVFGDIMTLLIALEFNHTLQYSITSARGIVQTRAVILIAQLALARKVIVIDLLDAEPWSVGALAVLAVALGAVYWLIDDRRRPARGVRSVRI